MKYKLVVSPEAELDIEKAFDWSGQEARDLAAILS